MFLPGLFRSSDVAFLILRGRQQTGMDFTHTRGVEDLANILFADPSASQDYDSPGRKPQELSQHWGSLFRSARPARGQHTVRSSSDHIFECCGQIGANIKCPMKGDTEGARQFYQFECPFHIDARAGVENPEDESVHSQLLRFADLVLDSFELNCCVVKVFYAGTYEDVQRNRDLPMNLFDEADAWSETFYGKVAAKLDPVRASALGRDCRRDRLDAHFENNG
jgi:hypothetical protein